MEIRRRIFFWTVFGVVSFVGGIVNGLLGAGAGVFLLYLFRWMLKRGKWDGDRDKDAFATVVLTVLPLSIVSSITYAVSGRLDTAELRILILPAVAGGFLGAILTDKLPAGVIRAVFAVLVIISVIRMVFF